jgi:hypothetical protein
MVNELETDNTRNPWQESNSEEKKELREFGTRDLEAWAADADDGWPSHLEDVYPAYMSLIQNEIRRAWVRSLAFILREHN